MGRRFLSPPAARQSLGPPGGGALARLQMDTDYVLLLEKAYSISRELSPGASTETPSLFRKPNHNGRSAEEVRRPDKRSPRFKSCAFPVQKSSGILQIIRGYLLTEHLRLTGKPDAARIVIFCAARVSRVPKSLKGSCRGRAMN